MLYCLAVDGAIATILELEKYIYVHYNPFILTYSFFLAYYVVCVYQSSNTINLNFNIQDNYA